jgi:acyl-CoA reductase-like NAD-dependent aldehyde dehydrogenase
MTPQATANALEVPAHAEMAVNNPATGEIITRVPLYTPLEVADTVTRARQVQPQWQELGFDARAPVFDNSREWVLEHRDRVIQTLCDETGKTYEDALIAEVAYIVHAFQFWAKKAPKYLKPQRLHSRSPFAFGRKLMVRYEPLGVVGVIGPWNYPLSNSFGDCLPALAAGNAVVLKPSDLTPLTGLLMAEMFRECGMPEGVYQVTTGDGATGAALIDEADYIMFTGSTATGKKVMERAAQTLTPVSLELGGKDPMIVCADADLERAANAAVFHSMQNSGQTCISIERVYVEAPVYDEFLAKVNEKVGALRQGVPGTKGTTEIGAITMPKQSDIIERHVQDALARGAKVTTGGHRRDNGDAHFFEPTVLIDVDHTMECMREETFGPTLPIMKVADADEAIQLANDSPYGLQGSVWTNDIAKGARLASRVQAGTVCVNDAQVNYMAIELPQSGWKTSGVGQRHGGADGIRKYCRKQGLFITRRSLRRELHYFPYSARRTRLVERALRVMYGKRNQPLRRNP